MLEILLIRHGQTDWNRDRRIMGRRPIPLNPRGRRESERVARLLRHVELAALYCSPVRRALQTAQYLKRGRSIPVRQAPAVAEIDYGRWVGRTFDDVRGESAYRTYHRTPGKARAPDGERVVDVYRRAGRWMEMIRKRHGQGRVAVVSHAEVIKAILVRYLGLPIDDLLRIRIDNASLSIVAFDNPQVRVLAVNCPASIKRIFEITDQRMIRP